MDARNGKRAKTVVIARGSGAGVEGRRESRWQFRANALTTVHPLPDDLGDALAEISARRGSAN